MADDVSEQTFPVSGKARLKLSNIRGSVQILPGEDGAIQVTAIKHKDTGDASRTLIEMNQESDGRVVVKTNFQEGILRFLELSKPCRVDYVVHLPRDGEVEASGVSSSVIAQGLEGMTNLSTVSGEIKLETLSGKVSASTVSGSIEGSQVTGPLILHTVSGGIRLENCSISSLDASTVSGGVRLETPLSEGPYNFHTVSGGVQLIVPAQTSCRIEFKAISGGIHCDLPVTQRIRSGGHETVLVGSGGPLVTFDGISGGLRLEAVGGEPVQPSQPPQVSSSLSPEAQHEILEKIARGEITAEEGLRALRS